MRSTPKAPLAFSYVRFSTVEQRKGDSLRRQTEDAASWCERNGMKLDESITLHDLGKSAFTGKHRLNPDRNALASFLKLVEAGKVPEGSFLILESLDRLTREHIRPALTLLLNLIEAGVRVVQLKPVEMIYDEAVEPMQLMMALMELSRGHSESKVKSQRVGDAWSDKRRHAVEGKPQPDKRDRRVSGMKILTHQLPSWIEERDGKPQLVPAKAAVIRKIFRWASEGYGLSRIVKRLCKDRVPAFGDHEVVVEDGKRKRVAREGVPLGSGRWTRTYVSTLLLDTRVLGEYQPRTRDRKPVGPPIPNYFPAVVSEDLFYRVRAEMTARNVPRGRPAKSFVNVFGGLLKNARPTEITRTDSATGEATVETVVGDTYYVQLRSDSGKRLRVLVNHHGIDGTGPCFSFPYPTFERAILTTLREVDPAEVLGTQAPNEVATIGAELDWTRAKIAELSAELLKGRVAAIADKLRQMEADEADLVAKLDEAKANVAKPLRQSFTEAMSISDALDEAPDEEAARLRLRSLLRRAIDSIWIAVTSRGRDRLAAVSIIFAGGTRTRYLDILHRHGTHNGFGHKPGRWWATSLGYPLKFEDQHDLRKPEHVEVSLKALLEWDPSVGVDEFQRFKMHTGEIPLDQKAKAKRKGR